MSKINFKGFIDTTLRDGAASPLLYDTYKYKFSLEEKKQLLSALIKLGVRHFEFFSPVVSQKEKNDFLKLKPYLQNQTEEPVHFLAHCRCHPKDIKMALEAGFTGLNLYIGLSQRAQKNYGKDLEEILSLVTKIIKKTRKNHPQLWIRYSGEDAFRTPLKNLFKVYDQVAPFVDTFGTPDTTGSATPDQVANRVRKLKERYPDTNLECHFHNDRGLALANTLTAIENGAEFIDSTIWGMAERSGITSITAALFNLYHTNKDLVKNYQLADCYPLNVLMGTILGWHVPWNEPVSLTNRTHIAGVHQKAVLNEKKSYESHSLEKFGVDKEQLLLGPLTGWNFIYYYLKEIAGYITSKEQAKEITARFKKQVKMMGKKSKPEKILNQIIEDASLVKKTIPQKYAEKRLENL